MMANVWLFELIRYAGALYLLYLAGKSLRAAWLGRAVQSQDAPRRQLFVKGLMLHLTNPKAIFAWGSIYAVVIRPETSASAVAVLFVSLILTSMVVFWGYALLFSTASIAQGYLRLKRWFDAAFGLLFGAAALKLLVTRMP